MPILRRYWQELVLRPLSFCPIRISWGLQLLQRHRAKVNKKTHSRPRPGKELNHAVVRCKIMAGSPQKPQFRALISYVRILGLPAVRLKTEQLAQTDRFVPRCLPSGCSRSNFVEYFVFLTRKVEDQQQSLACH